MESVTQYVYLAGPIAGCDQGEAKDWREWICDRLPSGIKGVSPLRCEPLIGNRYELQYEDPRFGVPKAIASKNEFDTRKCDIVLAYLPKELNNRRPSYGTIMEIAWAQMIHKQVILVTDDPYLQRHPLVSGAASWVLPDLQQALEVIEGVMGVYGR